MTDDRRKGRADVAHRGRAGARYRPRGHTGRPATPAARHLALQAFTEPARPARLLMAAAKAAGENGDPLRAGDLPPTVIHSTGALNGGQQAGSQHVRPEPAVGFWIPGIDSRRYERQTAGDRLRSMNGEAAELLKRAVHSSVP